MSPVIFFTPCIFFLLDLRTFKEVILLFSLSMSANFCFIYPEAMPDTKRNMPFLHTCHNFYQCKYPWLIFMLLTVNSFFFFLQLHLEHIEVPGSGHSNSNTGSLTHWVTMGTPEFSFLYSIPHLFFINICLLCLYLLVNF